MTKLIAVFLLLYLPSAMADVLLASWNVKRLGHKPAKDMAVMLDVLDDYDIIALQEVMQPARVADIEKQLEQRSEVGWEHVCSHTIGRNSYKEAYCFLWRVDRVSYETGAMVYLDPDDVFAREPFSAVFRSDDETFLLATLHVIYGDNRHDRSREVRALREYHDFLVESFPDVPRVLAGDFNLLPGDPAYATLREVARPAITQGATTLSSIDGRYANLYDNAWLSGNIHATEAGIRRFPEEFGLTHEYARRMVSDHAPIWLRLRGEMGSESEG